MSLQVWLPLNKDLRNNGTYTGNNWYAMGGVSYNVDGYFTFDGSTPTSYCITNSTTYSSTVSSDLFTKYLNNHSFSVSIWAKTASGFDCNTNNGGALITLGYGVSLRYSASGVPLVWLTGSDGNGGTVNNGALATTNCNDLNWHHLAFTYNVSDNAIKIYVDGVCEKTAYYPSGYSFVGNWTNNIAIGRDVNSSTKNDRYFFRGALYDFRIYDHSLSVKEVKELAKGLYLHYTLAENNLLLFNAFTYPTFNTSTSSGNWSHWGDSSLSVTGTYSQNTNKTYIYNKNNTYSHKVTKTGGSTGSGYLTYQNRPFGGGYRSALAIIKFEDSSVPTTSIIRWSWNANVGTAPATTFTSLGDGFYLMKCEGFQQDGSNDLVFISLLNAINKPVYISEAYLENHMKCCSDIFGHKTTNLITSLVAGEQTTVSDNNVTTSGTDADTYFKLNLSAALVSGNVYTISCDAELPDGTYWNFPIGSQSNTSLTWKIVPGYNEYTFTANSSCTGNPLMMDDTGGTARTAATVCKFNNLWLVRTGIQTITDNSGFNNNGTITGDLITDANSARYDKSSIFSGERLIIPKLGLLFTGGGSPFSISLWVRETTRVGNGYLLLNNYIEGSTNGWNFRSYNGKIRFWWTSSLAYTDENLELPLNTWVHIGIVYTSTLLKLYKNGQSTSTQNWVLTTKAPTNGDMYFGSTPEYNFNGSVSDLRVYKTALADSDILDLYQTGCAIDKNQNLWCYEVEESSALTGSKFNKTGVIGVPTITESSDTKIFSNLVETNQLIEI